MGAPEEKFFGRARFNNISLRLVGKNLYFKRVAVGRYFPAQR